MQDELSFRKQLHPLLVLVSKGEPFTAHDRYALAKLMAANWAALSLSMTRHVVLRSAAPGVYEIEVDGLRGTWHTGCAGASLLAQMLGQSGEPLVLAGATPGAYRLALHRAMRSLAHQGEAGQSLLRAVCIRTGTTNGVFSATATVSEP